jgi:hypothetical protein
MLASAVNLAELSFLDGDVAAAIRFTEEAEREARRRTALATLTLILSNLAGYRLHDNQLESGAQAAAEALSLSRAIGQEYLAVMCLEHLALAMALRRAFEPAARLLGFCDAHYRAHAQTREHLEQRGHDRLAALLQAALTPAHRHDLLEAGAAWTQEMADAAAVARM